MWTHKLLLVSVLISVSQANPLHQKLLSTVNEDQNSDGRYVLDDFDDIPSGPQFSDIRVREASEEPVHKESMNPVLEYSPVSIIINVGKSKANDGERIVHVPVEQLKQKQHTGIFHARDPASETFPRGEGTRRSAFNSEEPVRRSEHVSAGLQFFGYPIGPQFSKSSSH